MFREAGSADPVFTDTLELDLSTVVPSMAGPKRPQDRVALADVSAAFLADLAAAGVSANAAAARFEVGGRAHDIGHGDVVIAAITSCTNTSNPYVMAAAGWWREKRGPSG